MAKNVIPPSTALAGFGDSISVLFDNVINQRLIADNILTAGKTRDLHAAIIEDIDLDPFANKRKRNQDRIVAMAPQSEMDVGVLQLCQQTVKWVGHTHAERPAAAARPR